MLAEFGQNGRLNPFLSCKHQQQSQFFLEWTFNLAIKNRGSGSFDVVALRCDQFIFSINLLAQQFVSSIGPPHSFSKDASVARIVPFPIALTRDLFITHSARRQEFTMTFIFKRMLSGTIFGLPARAEKVVRNSCRRYHCIRRFR